MSRVSPSKHKKKQKNVGKIESDLSPIRNLSNQSKLNWVNFNKNLVNTELDKTTIISMKLNPFEET